MTYLVSDTGKGLVGDLVTRRIGGRSRSSKKLHLTWLFLGCTWFAFSWDLGASAWAPGKQSATDT